MALRAFLHSARRVSAVLFPPQRLFPVVGNAEQLETLGVPAGFDDAVAAAILPAGHRITVVEVE